MPFEGDADAILAQQVIVPVTQDHPEVVCRLGGQPFGVDEPKAPKFPK
jgi:hypothetical protein